MGLLVYLSGGSDKTQAQINNTPHLLIYYCCNIYQTDDECLLFIPVLLKLSDFHLGTKVKHFHLYFTVVSLRKRNKGNKSLFNIQTLKGYWHLTFQSLDFMNIFHFTYVIHHFIQFHGRMNQQRDFAIYDFIFRGNRNRFNAQILPVGNFINQI